MKITSVKYSYNPDRQEFKPQYGNKLSLKVLPKSERIHSIRLGQINKKYIFVNMKDYESHQLFLNDYDDFFTFKFKGITYQLNKTELENNLVQFEDITQN